MNCRTPTEALRLLDLATLNGAGIEFKYMARPQADAG